MCAVSITGECTFCRCTRALAIPVPTVITHLPLPGICSNISRQELIYKSYRWEGMVVNFCYRVNLCYLEWSSNVFWLSTYPFIKTVFQQSKIGILELKVIFVSVFLPTNEKLWNIYPLAVMHCSEYTFFCIEGLGQNFDSKMGLRYYLV